MDRWDALELALVLLAITFLAELPLELALVLVALTFALDWVSRWPTRPLTPEEQAAYLGEDDDR